MNDVFGRSKIGGLLPKGRLGKGAADGANRISKKVQGDWSLFGRTGQRKYLTPGERSRFLAAASAAEPEARALCLTLAYVGCRLSEALALTPDDIEVESGLIAIRSLKKRGKLVVRQVPAPPDLFAALAAVHCLDSFDDRRLWRWRRTKAWQIVKQVMASAQITRLPASPKGLRHGFGVHAVLSGVPLPLVQKWLGHASLVTTSIYTEVLGPEERQIAARMW